MKKLKITNKTVSSDTRDVYDIEVETDHHYILENGVVSHNSGPIYASSIVIATRKLKLKEDEDGNKTSEVNGIRAQCRVMKTRYSQPFTSVEIKIPYDRGMDPYSGLVDLFERKTLLVKEGNRLAYTKLDGTQIKMFRKAWEHNENDALDIVMDEFPQQIASKSSLIAVEPDSDPVEAQD
jgi:hypothetical protein